MAVSAARNRNRTVRAPSEEEDRYRPNVYRSCPSGHPTPSPLHPFTPSPLHLVVQRRPASSSLRPPEPGELEPGIDGHHQRPDQHERHSHALDTMLAAHEPYPAVVVDRVWNVLHGNRAMSVLMDGIPPHLLQPLSVPREGCQLRVRRTGRWQH
ncbi:MmyB family transcriptional regulator [Nonomuraea rubra]|uniref:MmyB family transcriptional regulator n=1 Tax=Nonomuraea rubra TaxID=46180 RepID=UPI003404C8A2